MPMKSPLTTGATMGLTMTDDTLTLALAVLVSLLLCCTLVEHVWSGVLTLRLLGTAVLGIVGHTRAGLSCLLSIHKHSSGKWSTAISSFMPMGWCAMPAPWRVAGMVCPMLTGMVCTVVAGVVCPVPYPMSHVPCRTSHILCHKSHVSCPMFHIPCPMSYVHAL
jgi:hypothetical protein